MRKILRIPTQAEGNPLYPLPQDYERLTHEGKRQARINACRQWLYVADPLNPEPRSVIGDRMVASLWFFDTYYLWPDPSVEYDPGFYDMPPLPTPQFHWDMVRAWATFDLNADLAPRGGAKTSTIRKDTLLRIVSCPRYSVVYATSTGANADLTGTILRDQAYTNSRIQDDWGKEYERMRPLRGSQPTGISFFVLGNGSWVKTTSAESRSRGLRPRRFRLDDPEYDEKASTSMEQVRAYMDRLLFKIALPMTMRANTGIDWVGTFVSKRHFLYHALQLYQTPSGEFEAVDRRFNFWNRRWTRACYIDPTTKKVTSIWPEMWPADAEERNRLRVHGAKTLQEIEAFMGPTAFRHEMLGEPGTSEEQFFKLDADPYGDHAWWIKNPDDALSNAPRTSESLICWRHKASREIREMPISEFLAKARLFQTVDTAFTESATSDLRCVALMALMPDNELFVLDLWSSRKGDGVLVQESLKMAQKWRSPAIYVEVVKQSFKLYQRFQSVVSTRLGLEMGLTHTPRILDIRPGTMDKSSKIATLDTRFDHGLIKLPVWRRMESGPWSRLFAQIEGFNPEASDGGLEHDDELDCYPYGTLVLTKRGNVPIEDVLLGDEVLTASGWKKVLANMDTGVQEIIRRFGIVATPNHPIWTLNRGYVELDSLEMTDTLVSCNHPSNTCGDSPRRGLRDTRPSGGGSSTTDTLRVQGGFETTSGRTRRIRRLLDRFIAMFGSSSMVRSLRGTQSTTRMDPLSTTTSRTLTVSLAGSILKLLLIWGCWSTSEARRASPIWRKFVRLLLNGTAPKRDWSGIESTLRRSVSDLPSLRKLLAFAPLSARDVERNTRRSSTVETSGAGPSVSRPLTEKLCESTSNESVSLGRQRTRCLLVEDVHQFFANGILGSNCCAMSLFVIKGRKREEMKIRIETHLDALEELRNNRHVIPGTDIPLMVPLQYIDPNTIHEVLRGAPPVRKSPIPIV